MFSLICVWINSWVNNREAGDLRHHRGHYGVSVMFSEYMNNISHMLSKSHTVVYLKGLFFLTQFLRFVWIFINCITRLLMATTFHEICRKNLTNIRNFSFFLYQRCSYSHNLEGYGYMLYEVALQHSSLISHRYVSSIEIGLKAMALSNLKHQSNRASVVGNRHCTKWNRPDSHFWAKEGMIYLCKWTGSVLSRILHIFMYLWLHMFAYVYNVKTTSHERYCISKHQQLDCWFNILLRLTKRQT